jgi:hypothetical protein
MRWKNLSLAHATTIQASAVWKFWNGTSEGWAECRVLSGT